MPKPELFAKLYQALFDPKEGALTTEFRQPLRFLHPVQKEAMEAYLTYEDQIQEG